MNIDALQRRLPLDLTTGRPLLDVWAIGALLNLDEDDVLYRIEDGQLPFAFDISSPGSRNREVRIWRGSLAGNGARDLGQAIADILPPTSRLSTVQLKRALSCSSSHVHDLVRDGCFEASAKHGLTCSVWVTRTSAAAFLESRRI